MPGQIKAGKAKGSWYLRVELPRDIGGGRRKRHETFRGTKREAEGRLRDLLRAVDKGELADDRMTMAVLLDRWLVSREAKGRANKTIAAYKQHVEDWLKPALGTLQAGQLRAVHIEQALAAWRASAPKGRREKEDEGKATISARTVRHLYDTLRAALAWAERSGIITVNPIVRVEAPAYEAPEIVTIDVEGVVKLLEEARKAPHPLVAPILASLGSGLRRGELLALRWSDVDLETGIVTVRRSIEVVDGERREKAPKTKRSVRANVLPAFVVAALRQQRSEQKERRIAHGLGKDDNAYVFDDIAGRPWHPETFSRWVNTLCDRAGIPNVTLQALRRSFGTFLLEAGVDMRTVSQALGHTNTMTTERSYLGVVPTLKHDLAARLQVLLGGIVKDGA